MILVPTWLLWAASFPTGILLCHDSTQQLHPVFGWRCINAPKNHPNCHHGSHFGFYPTVKQQSHKILCVTSVHVREPRLSWGSLLLYVADTVTLYVVGGCYQVIISLCQHWIQPRLINFHGSRVCSIPTLMCDIVFISAQWAVAVPAKRAASCGRGEKAPHMRWTSP